MTHIAHRYSLIELALRWNGYLFMVRDLLLQIFEIDSHSPISMFPKIDIMIKCK